MNARLQDAAAARNTAAVLSVSALNDGADLHSNNDAALRHAASAGYAGTVAVLLSKGANVHAEHDQALQSAVDNGHAKVAVTLLEHQAGITCRDDPGLLKAASEGPRAVIALCAERAAAKHQRTGQLRLSVS